MRDATVVWDTCSRLQQYLERVINLKDLQANFRYLHSNSVPETWARFSNNNIQRSQAERHASHDMRNRIEQLLNKAANLTLYYWNKVNNAFTEKIREQVEARNHLQTHLSKVRLPLPLMRVEHWRLIIAVISDATSQSKFRIRQRLMQHQYCWN